MARPHCALPLLTVLLWKEDEPDTRRLLSKALDLSSPQSSATATEVKEFGRARRAVLNVIARRDVAWAKRVIDADSYFPGLNRKGFADLESDMRGDLHTTSNCRYC